MNNRGETLGSIEGIEGIEKNGYFMATAHGQENVDDALRFAGILKGLELVSREFSLPVIYPTHPRSGKMMKEFGLDADSKKILDSTMTMLTRARDWDNPFGDGRAGARIVGILKGDMT